MGKRKYQEMLGEDVDFQWGNDATPQQQDNYQQQEESYATETSQPDRKKQKKDSSNRKGSSHHHHQYQTQQLDPITSIQREIASDPSSATGHIKLISYYLATHTLDKARHAARSGLKRLPIGALESRFQLYSAWIRLEHDYGVEADQEKIFEQALHECGTLYRQKLHYLLATIHEEKEDLDKAEEIYRKVAKKNGKKSEPWDQLLEFLIKHGKHKEAKDVLKKTQQALPSKKLKMRAFSVFAIKEYKFGSIVEGHKMMESIVSTYPDRTDMWSVFLDMELRAKRFKEVRRIFERVVTLKLSPKKMKSFLSRYMDFEKKHGNQEGVDRVRELARDYVERVSQA